MKNTDYDLVIIGAGPAGLTAALYAGRARLSVLLLEKAAPGGQILSSDWIENYPGFPEGISGADLMAKMQEQAQRFDVSPTIATVESIDTSDTARKVNLTDGTVSTKVVIIASGASPRKLNVPGEDEFYGRGVSVCATCDAPFYRNSVVAVVGGGDTAVQESLYLTRFAKKVYVIHRREALRATKIIQERAFSNDQIEIVWDSVLTAIKGSDAGVQGVTVKNVKSGDLKDLEVEGCFVMVGISPNAGFVKGAVDLDSAGFITVNSKMETSVPGIYAAGDVRNTPLRQVATAVGDGAIAAFNAVHYIENL